MTWDPARHPRDRRGRFTKSRTVKLTAAERAAGRAVIDGFSLRKFDTSQDRDAYLASAMPTLSDDQAKTVHDYAYFGYLNTNERMRSGADVSGDEMITALRAAMHPTPDDLIVSRLVRPETFAGVPDLQDLVGMKVRDAAFASTSLGAPFDAGDNIRLRIAVPAGTPAIFVAPYSKYPHEQEILLGEGLEMAVASVRRDSEGRWDISLVVLPPGGSPPRKG